MPTSTSTTIYGVTPTKRVIKDSGTNVRRKGYGLGYPLTKSLHHGFFNKEAGAELAYNNLQQLLRTEPGERVMLPKFGCSLNKYLFQPLDRQLFESIKETILTSVTRYAKNVEILKLGVFPLNEYGNEGLQAIQVQLIAKLKDIDNIIFEVEVRIG